MSHSIFGINTGQDFSTLLGVPRRLDTGFLYVSTWVPHGACSPADTVVDIEIQSNLVECSFSQTKRCPAVLRSVPPVLQVTTASTRQHTNYLPTATTERSAPRQRTEPVSLDSVAATSSPSAMVRRIHFPLSVATAHSVQTKGVDARIW